MTTVACAVGQALPRPQLIFPSETWFGRTHDYKTTQNKANYLQLKTKRTTLNSKQNKLPS
jgi:hypothetical protein